MVGGAPHGAAAGWGGGWVWQWWVVASVGLHAGPTGEEDLQNDAERSRTAEANRYYVLEFWESA